MVEILAIAGVFMFIFTMLDISRENRESKDKKK